MRNKTLIFSVLLFSTAVLCSSFSVPTMAAAEEENARARAFYEVLENCAGEITDGLGDRTLHLVSRNTTKLESFAASMLAFAIESAGHDVVEITPPEIPHQANDKTHADIFGDDVSSDDLFLLVEVGRKDKKKATISLQGMEAEDNGIEELATHKFFIPSALKELDDLIPERPPKEDVLWQKLLLEVVEKCSPFEMETKKGRALAEGVFFFENGYWKLAAESFGEISHEEVNRCLLYIVMAEKWGGNKEKAESIINDKLRLHPDSGPLYALKAWLTCSDGEPRDALMFLEQARLSDLTRENYYIFARYLIQFHDGKIAEAEESLLKAAESLPDTAFIQLRAARHYWRQAELEKSVTFYRRTIEAGLDDAEIYVELGLALDAAGDPQAAIEAFMNVFEHEKGDLAVARHLASLLRTEGRYEDALKVMAECVEANPDNALAAAALGDMYVYSWRIDESIDAYREAIERNPSLNEARVSLARAYLVKKDTEKAMEVLKDLIEEDRPAPEALIAYGEAKLKSGRVSEAIESFESAARDPESDYLARIWLSKALLEIEEYNRAVREAQLAVSSRPTPRAFAALARAFMKSGRGSDAKQSIERGLTSSPNSPDIFCAHIELKLFYAERTEEKDEKLNLYKEGLQMAAESINIDPFHLNSYLLGGHCALSLGDFEKCAEFWQKAAELDRWDPMLAWHLALTYQEKLGEPQKAASYFQRHIELDGEHAEEAESYLEK